MNRKSDRDRDRDRERDMDKRMVLAPVVILPVGGGIALAVSHPGVHAHADAGPVPDHPPVDGPPLYIFRMPRTSRQSQPPTHKCVLSQGRFC